MALLVSQHAAVTHRPGPSGLAVLETHHIVSEEGGAGNTLHAAVKGRRGKAEQRQRDIKYLADYS